MQFNSKIPLFLFAGLLAIAAQAQVTQFKHIIVVFQENRTPDNLFYSLCSGNNCNTTPDPCVTKTGNFYNIQLHNWLNASSPTGVTEPVGKPINNGYDLDHSHSGWKNMCDGGTPPTQCKMDGAYKTSPNNGTYIFVSNSSGTVTPYLSLAQSYGWANCMFQTNQGPSFPAHQFIFGGTSALSATDDNVNGIFVSENFSTNGTSSAAGCYAQDNETTKLAHPDSTETTYKIDHSTGKTVCIPPQSMGGRNTMADLLDSANLTWTYYSSPGQGQDKGGSIWTAPNALEAICVPDSMFQNCTGTEWKDHVVINPAQVLTDLGANGGNCNLKNVSWVIPTGANSDHPGSSTGGPAWVASIVNALGQSPCTDTINGQSISYWQDTAVVITWDDWGGFYDHEPPTILANPEGGYQLGFRVPMLFVSAYTPMHYINNNSHDFGSILRFIEHNFNLGEGALGFADKRATNNLSGFYDLTRTPRSFVPIPTSKTAADFINDKTPPTDPDDD
ncbi:MAG TPA: alkaline phosphatase family protein [Terriglobales bacterium]|nr:alkaline phosphatase family protein [Terriglobales bacterium]